MKPHALLALAIGLLIAAAAPKDDATAKDSKNAEGTWVMVSGEAKGEKVAADIVKNARLTIKSDKHTVKVGDDTYVGTHKLSASTDPKQIDSTDTEGPFKGKTALGIYRLAGDEFTICFAPPGKDRPKEFTTKSGTGEILHVWSRKKD